MRRIFGSMSAFVIVGMAVAGAGAQAGHVWTPMAPLLSPRATSAVMLEDGRILFPGSDDFRRDSEVYDPVTETSVFTEPLSVGRCYGCSSIQLRDGRVLVAGGWTGGPVERSAEIYDPVTNSFSPAANLMSSPRIGATIEMLPDGRVLIANGHPGSGINWTADIFDPATNAFTNIGNTALGRLSGSAVLDDGRVLLVGGMTGNGPFTNTAEVYDPATGTFSFVGSMTYGRHGVNARSLQDGRVLVAGGLDSVTGRSTATAEVFDPATDTFSVVGSMTVARSNHSTLLLPDGRVLVAGGWDENGAMLSSTEYFDPQTGTFTAGPSLTAPRGAGHIFLLADGRAMIAGGFQGNSRSRTVESLVVELPDTTPPVIHSVTPSESVLWSPNHTMRAITVAIAAADDSGEAPSCAVTGVASNEPQDGLGDGGTPADWEITGAASVNLRAERSGKGSGRIYTIAVQCTDAAGNSSSGTTTVSVPHSKR